MVRRYCLFLCWRCLCTRLQVTTNKGKRMTNYEKTKQEHIKITNAYQAGKEDGSAYEKACGQREWAGLTDEEVKKEVEIEMEYYWDGDYIDTTCARDQLNGFARTIEAKLKKKNT